MSDSATNVVIPQVLRYREAASLVKISESALRKEVREGRLKTTKIAGSARIIADDLRDWLLSGRSSGTMKRACDLKRASANPPPLEAA